MARKKNIALLILVASLGYFVDIYDLILFNIIKKASLADLGIPSSMETTLFNWQMTGMLIGGLFWGVWGDRKGRVSVLFGSILLYSIANIANAFVDNITTYSIWRFVAGIGLAGELGAAITLVSESMPQKKRGIGTMIIVTVGALGAVVAFLISEKGAVMTHFFESIFSTKLANWQTAYLFGGLLGLVLLALRAGAFESGMFHQLKSEAAVKRGNLRILFRDFATAKKYIACVVIGLPVWFVVGLLVNYAHRLIPEIGLVGPAIETNELLMWSYVGLSSGDLLSGLLSQLFKSRRKVILFNLFGIVVFSSIYLFTKNVDAAHLRIIAYLLGLVTGYWALFVTNASEQFGTNIRSTVTATVPNFVRGGVVPITLSFNALAAMGIGSTPNINAALIVGVVCIGIATWGVLTVKESFHKDLNYYEG